MTVHDAFDDFGTASTLLVTVQNDEEAFEEGRETIARLERGETVEEPDTYSFPDVETLFETFTPQTMALLEAIATHNLESIRETARHVDRDVKNVHGELTELARQGIVEFVDDGNAKRPVFPYDEIVINLPFTDRSVGDSDDVSVPS